MEVTDKQMIESAELIKKGCKERECYNCQHFNATRHGCTLNSGGTLPKNWQIPTFKPTLTDTEKVILGSLDHEYKWIARDKSGGVFTHVNKPNKYKSVWDFNEFYASRLDNLFPNLFQWCTWEDEEPWYIPELLKRE